MKIPKNGFLCLALGLGTVGIMLALAGCGDTAPEMSAEATMVSYEPSGAYTTTITPRDGVSLADLTAADLQVGYQIPDIEAMGTEEEGSNTNGDGSADSSDSSDSGSSSSTSDGGATSSDDSASSADTKTDASSGNEGDSSPAEPSKSEDSEGNAQASDAEGSQSSDSAAQDGSSSEDSEEGVKIPAKTVYAEVKEFTLADDGTATLSFEDPEAATNRPRSYSVYAEKNDFSTQVGVDYPIFTLTPDVAYVPATSEATKLTLALNDGEFAQEVAKDDIELYGSFEGMTVESLSSAGKNLTLQLTGTPKRTDVAGVYLDGSVGVASQAIQHASEVTRVSVPVQVDGASFVVSELSVSQDAVSVPLTIYGANDLSKITPQDVTFAKESNITVKNVEAKGESELALTLAVPNVDSANAAAKALDGQSVSVAGQTFTAEFPQASFYPVFDYVEDDGDNLNLTLIAYVSGGSVVEDPSTDAVTLSDGFEGGSVQSIERTGDTTAKIEITIPANGQKAETIDLTGTVGLAAGTLVNAWGEPTSEAATNTRSYSQDSLGRSLSLSDFKTVNSFVKGLEDSGLLSAFKFMGAAGSAASSIKTILTVVGIIPDPNEQMAKALTQINEELGNIKSMIATQTSLMQDISQVLYEDRIAKFDEMLKTLSNDNSLLERYFAEGAKLGVPLPDAANESLPKTPDNPYAGLSLEDQSKLYSTLLIEAMSAADKPGGACDGFGNVMNSLARDFSAVADAVATTSNYSNPIYNFDYLCTQTYNFDTIALPYRQAYRSDIELQLDKALALIYLRYNMLANPEGPQVAEATQKFNKATDTLAQQTIKTNDNVYFYIPGIYVYRDLKYADDLLMSQYRSSWWDWDSIIDPFATEAIRYYGNLNETQMNEFMKRLNGRTAAQELEQAQFTNIDYCRNLAVTDLEVVDRHYRRDDVVVTGGNTYPFKTLKNLGLSLNLRYQYEFRGVFRYAYKRYFADYVPWDESKLVKDFERIRSDEAGTNNFLLYPGYEIQNGTTTNLVLVK